MGEKRSIDFFEIDTGKKKSTSKKKGSGSSAPKKTVKKASPATKQTSSKSKTTQKKASSAKNSGKAGAAKNAVSKGAAASAGKGTRSGSSASGKKSAANGARVRVEENPVAKKRSYTAAKRPVRHHVKTTTAHHDYRRKTAQARKAVRRNLNRYPLDTVGTLLSLAIIAVLALGLWRLGEYRHFSEMKKVVSSESYYGGTLVDGVDISEMSLNDALEYWENTVEPQYRNVTVELDNENTVTAQQMGYSSNYREVLTHAWSGARTGTLEERYVRATSGYAEESSFAVKRNMYDDATVRQYAATLASYIDTEPKSASIRSFNMSNCKFEFNEGHSGSRLNQQALVQDMETALNNGGGYVSVQIETIAQEVSGTDISSQYGMICSAQTSASSSTENRLANIRLALSLINGTCLEPGESFSFNGTVGKRTEERGFREATAYSGGTVTTEIGGGICQVSTTLFNAVVKANLQIDERHSHSLLVHYVDPGKDAAVDWNNKDLKFTNNSSDKIYICCYLTSDKRIRVGIFGKLLPNGGKITIEGEKTGTIKYETKYQADPNMAPGTKEVIQKGENGCTAVAYKIYWDANGNEVKREELCKSRYQAKSKIIAYGPS